MKMLLSILIIFISLETYGQPKYTAYVFIAEECPVCNYIGKTLKKISQENNDNVKFVAVFPQRMSNYKTASLFKKKYGLEHFEIEIDRELVITKKYNGTVTPEVVVVDLNDNIMYQGRINNSYAAPGRMRHGKVTENLEIALNDLLRGKMIPKPWPLPIGCYITK